MSAWMHVAGWTLVHFVWEGALLALMTAALLRICRRQSTAVRYAIACGGLAMMLGAAVTTAALIQEPPARSSTATQHAPDAAGADRGEVMLPIAISNTQAPVARWHAEQVDALLPWIVSAWLFGVMFLLTRAVAGWWRVRRLHQLALSSTVSGWQIAASRIARRIGLTRAFRVVELPHVDGPLVLGCIRPIVVLPIAAMAQLNAAQVEAILAHELAHVRRHDYFVNLMQTLAETVLFYHPAVWWLSGRIRDEREHCCDEAAVAMCGDAVGYAAALAELEAWRRDEVRLAAAATGGSLLNRVRRILRVEVPEDSRISWTFGFVIALIVGGLAANVIAQVAETPAPRPAFEVASVRPNTSGSNQVSLGVHGGRFVAVNIPLVTLIRSAYRLQDSQLVGAPDWVETERYDITAKAEGDLPPPSPIGPPSTRMLMLQSLLEERFNLKVHREVRGQPVYALVPARSSATLGPKLTPSAVDCQAPVDAMRKNAPQPPPPPMPGGRPHCGMHMGFGQILAGGRPMVLLANALSQVVQRIVIDRTGLTGNFDFEIRWTPDQLPTRTGSPADQPFRMNGIEIDPNGPSIFTALSEQLGLKLESTRGPVDVLVIDHIERPIAD